MLVRPLKAIRFKCMDCAAWQQSEVLKCTHTTCILWHLRFGKRPKGAKYENRTVEEYRRSLENRV